jgi:hypothetical protein
MGLKIVRKKPRSLRRGNRRNNRNENHLLIYRKVNKVITLTTLTLMISILRVVKRLLGQGGRSFNKKWKETNYSKISFKLLKESKSRLKTLTNSLTTRAESFKNRKISKNIKTSILLKTSPLFTSNNL